MKFYAQNLLFTLLVLGCWFFAATALLEKNRSGKSENIASVNQDPKPFVKSIPGNERYGVVTRDIHFDADQLKRKEVLHFHDGAEMTVKYDSLSRLLNIVETRNSGESLVFTFDPKHRGELKKQELFRKDQTLAREIKASEKKDAEISVFYANDGKTPVCEQRLTKKGFHATCYHADGKTPRAVFYRKEGAKAFKLKFYTEKGVLQSSQEVIENQGSCGNPLCHECSTTYTATVKHYREDGKTVWLKVEEPSASSGGVSLPLITEYGEDGKTVVCTIQALPPPPTPPASISAGGLAGMMVHTAMAMAAHALQAASLSHPAYELKLYDAAGAITHKRTLRNDFSIVSEESMSGENKSEVSASPVDEKAQKLVAASTRENLSGLAPFFVPTAEPNHLRQAILAITE